MDRKELESWLTTRPQRDAILIAQRAALRVAPLYLKLRDKGQSQQFGPASFSVLRPLLSSGVAAKYPTPAVKAAAFAAARAAQLSSHTTAIFSDTTVGRAAEVADMAAFAAADAAAGDSVGYAAVYASTGTDSAAAAYALNGPDYSDAFAVIWNTVARDIADLAAGRDLTVLPLWQTPQPDGLRDAEIAALQVIQRDFGGPNSFWHRWWEGAMSGQWLDWDLQREVALIPDEVWQAGPKAVAEAIARIEEKFVPKSEILDETIAKMTTSAVAVRESFALAVWTNRQELPATLDAVLGYCALEIARLQQKNFRDDEDRDECQRQIRVLTTLHEAIARLAPMLQTDYQLSTAEAEVPEKLSRVALKALKEWPRKNIDDLVDSTYRFALVGVATPALMMMGVPANWAIGCTTALFGGKKIVDAVRAGSDSKNLAP